MNLRRLVPSPALVIASLALAIVSAQPVTAAVRAVVPPNSVGTAQLKDNAVTNRKIRPGTITGGRVANRSIGLSDLAVSARPSLPRVLSDTGGEVDLPSNGDQIEVVSVSVPAGSWAVHAKTEVLTNRGSGVNCSLYSGSTKKDSTTFVVFVPTVENDLAFDGVSVMGLITVSKPTKVRMLCSEDANPADVSIRDSKLLATQVRTS